MAILLPDLHGVLPMHSIAGPRQTIMLDLQVDTVTLQEVRDSNIGIEGYARVVVQASAPKDMHVGAGTTITPAGKAKAKPKTNQKKAGSASRGASPPVVAEKTAKENCSSLARMRCRFGQIKSKRENGDLGSWADTFIDNVKVNLDALDEKRKGHCGDFSIDFEASASSQKELSRLRKEDA
jgi:hypothetical protein